MQEHNETEGVVAMELVLNGNSLMEDYDPEDKVNNWNEWDVVPLTASTYAAAPSYWVHEYNSNGGGAVTFGGETPRTFLSDHFVFPPSQHENLPLEPDVDEEVEEERVDEETNEEGFSGDNDEDKNEMDTSGKQIDGKQQFGGTLSEEGETSQFRGVDVSKIDGNLLSNHQNSKMPNDDKILQDIPLASWWKRHASSLYSNAKESNSFWPIFVAAAVMGLVVVGQRWQQERWQFLQLKLHINVNDEKMVRLLGPLTRLKDAVIGSHHSMSFLRSSSPVEL